MQIKKITAKSFAAAMDLVKKEMGEDALVLNTRHIELPGKTPSGKPEKLVEITAARDIPDATGGQPQEKARRAAIEDPKPLAEMADPDLKTMVYTFLTQSEKGRAMGLKERQLALFKRLVDNGVHEKLAAKMFEKINAAAAGNPLDDERSMGELLKRAITCRGSIAPTPGYPKVVALVGPTGVGKTTTIAKLAAHYAINERKRVALVSLDTYRIGAVEQLRVYGDIMRLPVEVASGQKDFRKVLSKHSDKDLILVDTTGKCHRDHAHAGQLAEVLKMSGPVETHLVLSVTLQEKILEQAHKQFAPLNVDGVLFTKLDEGMSFGSMLNFTLQTRLPFTYLTTGQRVPEDIEVAAHDRVIRLIFN